jgi:hypothetical protein
LCQSHMGRIKAKRDLPSPALSLTVLFEPPAPKAQTGCAVSADTDQVK